MKSLRNTGIGYVELVLFLLMRIEATVYQPENTDTISINMAVVKLAQIKLTCFFNVF